MPSDFRSALDNYYRSVLSSDMGAIDEESIGEYMESHIIKTNDNDSLTEARVSFAKRLDMVRFVDFKTGMSLDDVIKQLDQQNHAFVEFPVLHNLTYKIICGLQSILDDVLSYVSYTFQPRLGIRNGRVSGHGMTLKWIDTGHGIKTLAKVSTPLYSVNVDKVHRIIMDDLKCKRFRPLLPDDHRYNCIGGYSPTQINELHSGVSQHDVKVLIGVLNKKRFHFWEIFFSNQVQTRLLQKRHIPELSDLTLCYLNQVDGAFVTCKVRFSIYKGKLTLQREVMFYMFKIYGRYSDQRALLKQYELHIKRRLRGSIGRDLDTSDPANRFFEHGGSNVPIKWLESNDKYLLFSFAAIKQKWLQRYRYNFVDHIDE